MNNILAVFDTKLSQLLQLGAAFSNTGQSHHNGNHHQEFYHCETGSVPERIVQLHTPLTLPQFRSTARKITHISRDYTNLACNKPFRCYNSGCTFRHNLFEQ